MSNTKATKWRFVVAVQLIVDSDKVWGPDSRTWYVRLNWKQFNLKNLWWLETSTKIFHPSWIDMINSCVVYSSYFLLWEALRQIWSTVVWHTPRISCY